MTILGKQKIDCGRHIQDQEEGLEELAGQVQPLEQAKPGWTKQKAQMSDEELEGVQCNAQKKVKALEVQLNYAHKTRTLSKAARWQLRNQLEDVKCTRTVTFKAKQGLEIGLLRMQSILQDADRQKQLAKMLKKFKDTGQQTSLISKLQTRKNHLREQLAELTFKESMGNAR